MGNSDSDREKNRLIVLPVQPGKGQVFNGIGLAVHFLLANVMGVHTGLKESWLGSRVKKIFIQKERFKAYVRGNGTHLDLIELGRAQGIRYWIEGTFSQRNHNVEVALDLTDIKRPNDRPTTKLVLDTLDHLTGFRKDFITWLDECRLPFPEKRTDRALWPEKTTLKGMDLLGRALEQFYLYPSWGEKGPLGLARFDQAVDAAPTSFLANDIKGWILYKNMDYEAAAATFKKALQSNADGMAVLAGLMWCAIFTGNKDQAYQWAEARFMLRGKSREAARAFVDKKMNL